MTKKAQLRRKPIDAMVAALERIADALERNAGSPNRTSGTRSAKAKLRPAKLQGPDLSKMLTFKELRDYLGGRPKHAGNLPLWRGKVGGCLRVMREDIDVIMCQMGVAPHKWGTLPAADRAAKLRALRKARKLTREQEWQLYHAESWQPSPPVYR